MEERIYKPEILLKFSKQIFDKLGLNEQDSEIVSRILIETDLRGINSHGVARIPIYAKRIKLGLINPKPNVKIIKESNTSALIDADNGMGHIASYKAMKMCIDKAKKYGMGSTGVRNSNHFGINAFYSMMASAEGLIGMTFTNTSPLMAPFGGRERLLGSNPLCIAVPAGEEPDVVLDMATSVVARGKIEVAARKGMKIPEGWAIDTEGRVTVDPKQALEGALLPFGGPKGYGLAMLVDILSGVLTGSQFGPETGSLFGDLDRPQEIGHFFMAVNIENFMPLETFKQRMDSMIRRIRNSEKAKGFDRIYMPGEIEHEKTLELQKTGIPVNDKVISQLNDLAASLDISERL
jgi:LDH2 family malate/lactate/ureidoglycolate dehydrogenase